MRKVLLTVLTVSSLLAFNACKKDGATGPAGPAGPTGAAGPAGAVGPQGAAGVPGATGAAGSKILSGTVDPVTADGAVGDYFFNKTTQTLWGPKVAAGWAGTATQLTGVKGATGATGATGAVGATGANGTQFLAGAGVPSSTAPSNANVGDYYFDTTTGIFYGPKQADGTWLNSMPLGSAYAAKTYNLTRGFEGVTGTKVYGSDLINSYTGRNNFGSLDFKVTADDIIRMNQFPARADGTGGYSEDREMVFETSAGSNIWTVVAKEAANFGKSTLELAGSPVLPETYPVVIAPTNKIEVGARFRYSHNSVNPLATFTLTQNDIDRFKSAAGSAFGYFTHAKIDPTTLGLGSSPVFYDFKTTTVKKSATRFYGAYTAQTTFNLNTLIPNIEKYKQDGKVFLKYRYYGTNATATSNNMLVNHPGQQAGWADITNYVNSYATATSTTAAFANIGISDVNPFGLGTGGGLTNYGPATAPANHPMGTAPLGTTGNVLTLAPTHTAIARAALATNTAGNSYYNNGNVRIFWDITTGINAPLQDVYIGPTEFRNPNPTTDTNPIATAYTPGSVYEAFVMPGAATDSWITRGGFPINTPLTTRNFYSSATLPGATLFVQNEAGTTLPWVGGLGSDVVKIDLHRNGQPESYFQNTKLVKLQVFVIPGDVVQELKAKGVDVDNINEVSKHVKL